MKILIFSDSHAHLGMMHQWIYKESPDYLIHLGDYYEDLPEAIRVPGNCDHLCSDSRVKLIEFAGVPIFITHGNLHGVKHSLERLIYDASKTRARLVFFGHTHIPYVAEHQGMIVMNPGSAIRSGISIEIEKSIQIRFLGDTMYNKSMYYSLK